MSDQRTIRPVEDRIHGVLGQFAGPNELLAAAEKVRAAGYTKFDCHSPFPIHGMDRAMGMKASKVGYIAGISGLIGGCFGFWLQWWSSTEAYPFVIAGKPYNSYQAFVIITFGFTILFSALGAFLGSMITNRLPQLYHGAFYSKRFEQATDDGFFVSIEAQDTRFDQDKSRAFLTSIGASYVEVLKGP